MNQGLEFHRGEILSVFIICSEWKTLSSHRNKTKQKSVWTHVLTATRSEMKTHRTIVQTTEGAITKGSVFDHQSMEGKIYIANKFYASNWIPSLLLHMPLCWSYIFLNFSLLPCVTTTPLLTHGWACFHSFQVPLWSLSKPLLSQSF